jgi:mono/diheme cytochrome c family protein
MKPTCFILPVLLAVALLPSLLVAQEKSSGFSAKDYEYFEKTIRPLLHKRCYSCHGADTKKLRGGLRLDSRAGFVTGGDSGPLVVAGKPDDSLIIGAIRYDSVGFQMPPVGKLPQAEIDALIAWVKRGAPYPNTRKGGTLKRQKIDIEAGRKFWSFQPLSRQPLPEKTDAAAKRGRIDAFVLAELEKRKLRPSSSADRRTLIRRLSFDLTGLPPAPAEVESFVADKSPDTYERLVERLLASPHYGERWARLWLDLARYTDATASWLNSTGHAYLYRDWVTAAFNRDMPYDEFVKRQLATDLMPETGPEDTPALGFLGLSPTYWKELKLPAEIIKVIVADEWEERIDTVSRTFLGLTVACARCHDHKFDPITNEDYYALAGVFASTRLAERPVIAESDYAVVKAAHAKVKKLKAALQKLRKMKPPAKNAAARIAVIEKAIRKIEESTPQYHTPTANAVADASLYVERAGKTSQSGTRLDYKPEPRDLHIFIRGNPNNLGPLVKRRFLSVLSRGEPKPFTQGSGRLELAESIVGDAAPLAARVMVNRIWLAHFGRGLVETPSNFGVQGVLPSHPELLEDLAARFVENGWSIKWLHQEIVLSKTYRQSSDTVPTNHAADPKNRWLWRMNRRRLDIESWRDAMLFVSGRLDGTLGGPSQSLAKVDNSRRTLYGTINRRDIPAILQMHDFPDPTAHSPRRLDTTTPLQGLFVLNSPLMAAQSAALAGRIRTETPADVAAQIQTAYRLLFNRAPTDEETALGKQFLDPESKGPTEKAWTLYAQVLLGSNEFQFVD